jgi:hypothetical protein
MPLNERSLSPTAIGLLAVALSLAFRLPTLSLLPAWGDEVITIRVIQLPPLELIADRLRATHMPTYFLLLQALGLDGSSLFLLRLPGALADSLGAGLLALVACRLGTWRAGVALALIYAAMPVLLVEAQDSRPYGLFFGCLALFLHSAVRLVDHPRLAAAAWRRRARPAAARLRWTWLACALAGFGAIAILPLGVFAVGAIDLAVLWLVARRRCRPLFWPWLTQRLATLLLLAPLLYGYAGHAGGLAGHYWYGGTLLQLLRALRIADGAGVDWDPNVFLAYWGNRALMVLFLLLVVGGVLWARRRAGFAQVLALAFGTQVLLIAVSQHTPLYTARYFAVATPSLALLAACGLAGLWQRRWWLAAATAAPFFALLFLQSLDAMHQLDKPRLDLAASALREAGVERLGFYASTDNLAMSVGFALTEGPQAMRLRPWQVILRARQGLLVWVIDARRIEPLWPQAAAFAGLATCRPRIPGLRVLALAATPAALATSCPAARS